MKRIATLGALLGMLMLLVGPGSATAGTTKLVEGTVYDTTCSLAGECGSPCPPPCGGPIVEPQSRADYACTGARPLIVCPLVGSSLVGASPDFCLQGLPCGVSYPVYSGEGATVTGRRRAETKPSVTIPIVDGHFRRRLEPGEWVFSIHLHLEDGCWSGEPVPLHVVAKASVPLPLAFQVGNNCAAEVSGAP